MASFSRRWIRICCGTLLISIASLWLHAAEVRGIVKDQSGAVVANAVVELRSPGTALSTHSDESGAFLLRTDVLAGTIVISAPGFTPAMLACCQADQDLVVSLKPAAVRDSIVVTADRQPTQASEASENILLLGPDDLNAASAPTLDDALRQAPGFTLFRRSSSLTANPTTLGASARGIGANGAGRLLVLQDGVPLNDPFGGWVYWDRTPRLTFERAEVLRGGGSNLYGSAALAGVVDLLTRPPANLADVQVSGGGLDQRDLETYISHQFGAWGLTGTGESFGDDGAFVVAPEDRGLVDTPASLRFSNGTVRVDHSFGSELHAFVSGALFAENRNNGTVLQINSTHLGQITSGFDFTGLRQTVSTRFYATGEKLHQSFSSIAADRSTENLVRWQTVPSDELGFSAQWAANFSSLRLTAGMDGRFIHGESDETGFAEGVPTSIVDAGGSDRTVGIFGQVSGSPLRRLRVSAGARVDRWVTDNGFSNTLVLSTGALKPISVGNHTETAASPRLGAVYQVAGPLQAVASAYGGFRAPTLNELYRNFRLGNIVTDANAQLHAEHLLGGETGLRLVGQRYMLSGTFFVEHVDDPIANVTQSVTAALITRQRQNIGALRARGIDLDALFTFSKVQFHTGYEFVNSIVTSFSADPSLVGNRVPQTPAHVVTESLTYFAPRAFTFQVLARASSSQFDDDQNLFPLAPYSTVGVSVARQLRAADFFLAVSNLFDSRIETAATPVTSIAPGRLISAGLRFRFSRR